MKLKTIPLMLLAIVALPMMASAQLFSNCTNKKLVNWSFDSKTVNPDFVDSSVSVTVNPTGRPNNGVGFGAGPGGAGDFVACFPSFGNSDGYIDFSIKGKGDCVNFGGLTFDYLTETRAGGLQGPTTLNFKIYNSATNKLLFETNTFSSSTSTWKKFDINNTASYNGVKKYDTSGWEKLIGTAGLRFEIGGWYGNTWQTGLDINNLKITGCNCIPEPATTGLAGLAAALLFVRRRRN